MVGVAAEFFNNMSRILLKYIIYFQIHSINCLLIKLAEVNFTRNLTYIFEQYSDQKLTLWELPQKTDDQRILLIIFLKNPRLPVTYLLPDPINELSVESKVANCFFTVVYRVANKFSDGGRSNTTWT